MTEGSEHRIGGSWLTETSAGRWLIRLVTFAGLIIAWEVYAAGVSRALLAPPSEIVVAIREVAFVEGEFWTAVLTTLGPLLGGFLLAAIVGTFIGVLIGRFRIVEYVLDPYVAFLYALPNIALIPVFVIWFGIGAELRVFLVFAGALFPIIISTATGVKHVDPELISVGRVNCASERQIVQSIILPAALPHIFSGYRVGLGAALIAVIVVEMVVLITGLGGMVKTLASEFRTAAVFVPLFAIMFLSLTITEAAERVRRWLTPWNRVDEEL